MKDSSVLKKCAWWRTFGSCTQKCMNYLKSSRESRNGTMKAPSGAAPDHAMLDQDIKRVDDIYLWFVRLKEERIRLTKK